MRPYHGRMKARARPITIERLDRMMRWSMLWLLRLAAWIVEIAGVSAPLERAVVKAIESKLAIVARGVCMLIAAKAALRMNTPKSTNGGAPKIACGGLRVILGSRLRTLVRAKNLDVRAKIAGLLMLLQNADQEVSRFARRLRRGLTRRLGGVSRAAFETQILPMPQQVAACVADTS